MLRPRIDLLLRCSLHDNAGMLYRNARRNDAHHCEVVRDEEIAQAEPFLQVEQQINDLGLHRDMERGDRLVADDEIRIEDERACDQDVLPLAAGEFIPIARGAAFQQSCQFDNSATRSLRSFREQVPAISSSAIAAPIRIRRLSAA